MAIELGWGTPVGLGIFLVCFGFFVYLVTRPGVDKRLDRKKGKK